jgi:hypothetical protein
MSGVQSIEFSRAFIKQGRTQLKLVLSDAVKLGQPFSPDLGRWRSGTLEIIRRGLERISRCQVSTQPLSDRSPKTMIAI